MDYLQPKLINCSVCGEPFDANERNRGKGIQKYCSKKCRTKADNKRAYQRRKKPTPILDRICVICDLPFKTDAHHPNALTCSIKCNEARMNRERRMKTMRKVAVVIRECDICGKQFQPHRRSVNVQKYCSPECSHEAKLRSQRDSARATKNINPRSVRFRKKDWQDAKARILARDKSCRLCGSSDRLHVHHITHLTDDERNDHSDENLIALCGSCHNKAHRFELGKKDGKWIISSELFNLLGITEVTVK